ncbi:hypothetical protein ONZ45_g1741 [Pleurotus djamor]|nr:hypothetical protein ONZ45_g1741 [Pleurotus djamor]
MSANVLHDDQNFIKGPKRKRLTKACDPCHKSKRRCDGALPCSNCEYASKRCSYTDASGRPVPAPRPYPNDRGDANAAGTSRLQQNPNTHHTQYTNNDPRYAPYPQHLPDTRIGTQTNGYPPNPSLSPTAPSTSAPIAGSSTSIPMADANQDERLALRKRQRADRDEGHPEHITANLGLGIGGTIERPIQVTLDNGLTRELTNLFFTHCHPAQFIIHKPSFSTALQLNRVPSYLLHAVCALAAPLSKQTRLRTSPIRNAGRPFAQEAMSLMFDGAGRLKVDLNLATAQALCLLQLHEMIVLEPSGGVHPCGTRYHDLALRIIDSLGVHQPDHPTLTPLPSPEFIHKAVEQECRRGAGWERAVAGAGMPGLGRPLIGRPDEGQGNFSQTQLQLRLPVDETSFELAVHSTLPEYLFLPAIRTQYASELGHLIRVLTIYAKIERALDLLNGEHHAGARGKKRLPPVFDGADRDTTQGDPHAALQEADVALDAWANSLPDHLRFSEQSLRVQLSMFETSANSGAWCYCMTHVVHASAALGLNAARHRSQWAYQREEVQWAIQQLELITNTLGGRAKNSSLLGAVIWAMVKYAKVDQLKLNGWVLQHEEYTAVKMHELAQKEWHLVHTPHLQPSTYPTQGSSPQDPLPHPHPQQPMYLPPPPPPSSSHQSTSQHQTHPPRRLSEARPPTVQINPPIPRPPPHQHGGDVSYNNRGRSPSDSPSIPIGHPVSVSHGVRGSGTTQGQDMQRDRERVEMRANGNGGSSLSLGGSPEDSKGPLRDSEMATTHQGDHQPLAPRPGMINVGNGETVQQSLSLPSLKASGLLDFQKREDMKMGAGSNGPLLSGMGRPPVPPFPSHEPPEVRSSGVTTMPVGLNWLADE